MKKFLKKAEGFTLVELIVVIAILGILAGVAVPAYTGYIKKANDAAVNTELAAIQTAATAANATAGAVTKITVSDDGKTVIVTGTLATTFANDYKMFYTPATAATMSGTSSCSVTIPTPTKWEDSSYAAGATWTSTGWAAGNN